MYLCGPLLYIVSVIMKPSGKVQDCQTPELHLHSVCAWALRRLDCVLDKASMWLTDAEATAVVEIPDTNLVILY